jgi:thiol-disulfide isomerase/thioredoxin
MKLNLTLFSSDELVTLAPFTSVDLENQPVDEKIFSSGKVTMVNIWATFCSPCLSELPSLGSLAKEYEGKGFQIIGIPVDVTDEVGNVSDSLLTIAKSIVEQKGATYRHILPSKSLYRVKLDEVYSVPETIFVDSKGNQLGESIIGSRSKEDWKKIIEKYLKAKTE